MIGAMETDKRMIGRCHCGAVEIAIPADTDFSVARRCDCSYCRRRWVPTAGVDADNIEVIKGADMLTLYQFNTKKAEHFFCRHCGIYTHHRRRSDTSEFGVNITCFDHINMQDYNNVAILDGINHPKDRKLET
jgi:hypothetical protein